jgi:hypothetical protein
MPSKIQWLSPSCGISELCINPKTSVIMKLKASIFAVALHGFVP